jgi:hypothetical protein
VDDVKILKTDEEVVFGDNGQVETKMRVAFKVGVHGPFYRRFPKEAFDPVDARRQIDEFARGLDALHR